MQAMATTAYHAPVVPVSVSVTVMKLLTDAGMMIDADRVAAKFCLAQATALLRADRATAAPVAATDIANRSGLAPWQISKVKAHVNDNLGTPSGSPPSPRLPPQRFLLLGGVQAQPGRDRPVLPEPPSRRARAGADPHHRCTAQPDCPGLRLLRPGAPVAHVSPHRRHGAEPVAPRERGTAGLTRHDGMAGSGPGAGPRRLQQRAGGSFRRSGRAGDDQHAPADVVQIRPDALAHDRHRLATGK